MNRLVLILAAICPLFLSGYAPVSFNCSQDYSSCLRTPSPCDSIPELNKKILEIVGQQIGKTVGRGECWDLAALVLNQNGAKWDGRYAFGSKVDPEKECVFPGDIIQFENVKISYTRGRAVHTETMGHHTAIIREVKSQGVFVLAHQNTGTSGRTVGLSDLDLKTIVKGEYQVFRPVR